MMQIKNNIHLKIFSAISFCFSFNMLIAQTSESINCATVIDTYYNQYIVEDKYRCLEDVNSEQIKKWVDTQNKASKKYLSRVMSKTNAFKSIDKYRYIKYDFPVKKGKYYFKYGYYNNLGSPALFYQTTLKSEPSVLVDPNFISGKDEIRLKYYTVSKNSKYLAYQFSRNGSDWAELKILSFNGCTHLKDHLTGLKFSNIQWLGEGFFYSTYSQVGKFGKTYGQKVMYHKLDTPQAEDELIFERKNNANIQFFFKTTYDEKFFIIKEINEQLGYINIYYIDYESSIKVPRPLIVKSKDDIAILESRNGNFIALTSHGTNSKKMVEFSPSTPLKWKVIIPEFSDALLLDAIILKDRIFTVFQKSHSPLIMVMDYDGKILYKMEMPVGTSVSGISGDYSDDELLFYFQSFTIPPVVYKFNVGTLQKELTKMTELTFDYKNIEYKEVEALTNDSVSIPIMLVYEKGIKLDGTTPLLLEAYGGFGTIAQPSFDPGVVYFVKKGGIYAYANIRGGGFKGADWAKAGQGINKKNSFNDFITAAEYLIDKKYTNPDKLGITGASNGGLVVAASTIKRPDLFNTVVPVVAPTDMLRFEKFTVGHWHIDEYGTVNDSTEFTELLSYSPYHNIKNDVNYPTMLVVTSENDDRVPPFHSYKFVARLQGREAQKNPILLNVREKSGHSGKTSLYSNIKETANIYGFIMYELTK